jgi:peptidyl-prolyl cis-trans isomerase C
MKRPATLCTGVLLAALSGACGSREEAPAAVPEGFVAVVSGDGIAGDTVERVAQAQSLTARAALDRALSDAFFAAEGRSRVHRARVLVAERRAGARMLLQSAWAEARAAGPPTDAEVAAETARRWWEVDRPELRRTIHAVVLTSTKTDDAHDRAFAQRVTLAVATATEADSFRMLAAPFKDSGFDFRVEDLAPVARDGSSVEPSQAPPPGSHLATYEATYAAAVFKIPGVGRQSGIVKTSFGYHVILLTEILPEYRVPLDERRKAFTEEITLGRASKLRDAALERARAVDRVEVERSAGELTEKVNVTQ